MLVERRCPFGDGETDGEVPRATVGERERERKSAPFPRKVSSGSFHTKLHTYQRDFRPPGDTHRVPHSNVLQNAAFKFSATQGKFFDIFLRWTGSSLAELARSPVVTCTLATQ